MGERNKEERKKEKTRKDPGEELAKIQERLTELHRTVANMKRTKTSITMFPLKKTETDDEDEEVRRKKSIFKQGAKKSLLKAISEKQAIEDEKKRLSEGSGEESKAKKKWFSKDKSIVDPQSYETFVKKVNDNNNEGMKTLTKQLDNLSKEVTNVMKQTKDIETIKKDMGSLQKNVDGVYKKIDEQDVKREKYHDQKNKLEEKKLEQQKLKEERDHEKSMRKTDQDAERDKIKLEKD